MIKLKLSKYSKRPPRMFDSVAELESYLDQTNEYIDPSQVTAKTSLTVMYCIIEPLLRQHNTKASK